MKSPSANPVKWLSTTIFVAIGLSLVFAAWLGWQQFDLRRQIETAQTENKTISENIRTIEGQDVGVLYAANQILETALSERIEWSVVAQKILALEVADTGIDFEQVQVDPLGQVSVSGNAESLKHVAVLLQKLRNNENFTGPFVPGINGQSGRYNFQLQFSYLGL